MAPIGSVALVRVVRAQLLITLLLLGALVVTSAQAQDGRAQGAATSVPDDERDVVLLRPQPDGHPAPVDGAYVAAELSDPVDLTEVRFHSETPAAFELGLTARSFTRTAPQVLAGVVHAICFDWAATGDSYRLLLSYTAPAGRVATSGDIALETGFFLDRIAGECGPFARASDVGVGRLTSDIMTATVDVARGSVDVRIPRAAFAELAPTGETGPIPMRGDVFADLRAFAVGRQGMTYAMYDATKSADVVLGLDTGNDLVKVIVEPNFQTATIGVVEDGSIPMYSVQAGQFQTVPIRIENWLDGSRTLGLTARVVEGDPGAWSLRLLPAIEVGPRRATTEDGAQGVLPGSETVTLVVHSVSSVGHRDGVRIEIAARDPEDPSNLGFALVDLKAVVPPGPDLREVYLHGTSDACRSNDRWLNTMKTDPGEVAAARIQFRTCAQGDAGVYAGAVNLGLTFAPDVPFGYRYTLDTTGETSAVVGLQSVYRQAAAEHVVEQRALTVVNVDLRVLAGPAEIARGSVSGVTLDGTAQLIDVPVRWAPIDRLATTRTISSEEPFRVQVSIASDSRTFEICNDQWPCEDLGGTREMDVPVSAAGNRIYLLTEGATRVSLPIVKRAVEGEQVEVTRSGALLTLRQTSSAASDTKFANPGKDVVFDLVLRNEGVAEDIAVLSAEVDREGYSVALVPGARFALAPAEAAVLQVRVTTPASAVEADRLNLTLTARSETDQDALARLGLGIVMTQGVDIASEEVDPELAGPKEQKDSPGPAMLPLTMLMVYAAGRHRWMRART